MKQYYVYIITNKKHGVLYIGRTVDLVKRIYDHKQAVVAGFSKRYNLKLLVHYEIYNDHEEAAKRELNMKAWQRQWKIELIEKENPDWNDLYHQITA